MKAEVKFFNDEEVRAMAGSIANGKSKDAVEIIIGQIENDYDLSLIHI